MSSFNWVDYIFLLIFFFSIIAGFARGLIREVISLVALVAAFIIAILFSSPLGYSIVNSNIVQNIINHAQASTGVNATTPAIYVAIALSFGVLFAAVVLLGAIVSFLIGIAFRSGILGIGNRILGAGFGFVRGLIINLVIIFVVQLTPVGASASWVESSIVRSYQPAVQWLGTIVSPALQNLEQRFYSTLQNVESQMQGQVSNVTGRI